MATGRMTVFRAIPGSTSLGPLLRDFERKRGGVVTAFSDSLLPLMRQMVGQESTIEVVSFGEVVRNFLVLCGEEVWPIAQSGHTRAAISHSCGEFAEDSPFFKSCRFEGFHEAVSQTLEELRHWRIDADAMDEVAEVSSPRLAAKLKSLAELDRNVVNILAMLGRQQHSSQLMSSLDSTPELEGDLERLFVVIGSEESPLRIQWLSWIADQGIDVTLVFDRHATEAPIFSGAVRSIEALGELARESGDGNRLTRNLFADLPKAGAPIEVSITSAADPLAEAEWAIRGCLAEANPEGAGIYVRDLEGYAPLIESVARRFKLPIRIARRAPLLTNSFARLTLTALKFCASSDVRTLSPILRSSYLHLAGSVQHGLDVQLRTCYSQRGEQWPTLEAWVTENAEANDWLVSLLNWRRQMLLGGLRLPEWYKLLKEFNRDQRLPWVTQENKGGEMDERDRRALNQMERLLAHNISVDDVTKKSSYSLDEFVNFCEKLWSEGDVSIPTEESGVRVTADPYVIGDVEKLFVLGMLEGVFPRRRSEDPILTDAERAEISSLRPAFPALPDSRTKAEGERDEFYRVCSAAGKGIVFSYPQADDQRDNIPAFYLSEVARAAGEIKTHNYPRPELAPTLNECLALADIRLRESIEGPRQAPLPIELVTEQVRGLVRPDPNAAFEPSVLRDALQCPFQYLTHHVLRLRVNRRSSRWSSLRKLPQVAQILTKTDLADAERAMIVALNAELDQLYADAPDWEMQLLRAGGRRLIRDWLHRERRSREEWPKVPGTTKANVSFGTHGVRDRMPAGEKVEGAIAGISRLENYNVAHIYGSAPEDVRKLKESDLLFFGLHLLAIHENGRDGALEIESNGSRRTLLVLGRGGSAPLPSSVADGLQVLDLASDDDLTRSKVAFYTAVRRHLAEAVKRIYDVNVQTLSGEHCGLCDYGELCRRAYSFGEEESPFGLGREVDDV